MNFLFCFYISFYCIANSVDVGRYFICILPCLPRFKRKLATTRANLHLAPEVTTVPMD